ncbi:Calcium-binding protein PBP1 [Capsicum annuum]|nr:Calcium-binding protein PBP1 [Capsicum annuum]
MDSRKSNFNDLLPFMAEKLGGVGLIDELCKGFELLMDRNKGVITFESLKKNSALLGLQDLSDDDLRCMVKEGDFDGDGALNQMEFCVLMFRLSPELMEESQFLLDEALHQDSDFTLPVVCTQGCGPVVNEVVENHEVEITSVLALMDRVTLGADAGGQSYASCVKDFSSKLKPF